MSKNQPICNCGADRTGPTAEGHLPSCPIENGKESAHIAKCRKALFDGHEVYGKDHWGQWILLESLESDGLGRISSSPKVPSRDMVGCMAYFLDYKIKRKSNA